MVLCKILDQSVIRLGNNEVLKTLTKTLTFVDDFMIYRHLIYVAELAFQLTTPGSAVKQATDCAMEPCIGRLLN